jgi:hypothetical protein
MSTAPDEPSTPDEEPQVTPGEESPEEPGIGAQEARPIVAPDPVEDA